MSPSRESAPRESAQRESASRESDPRESVQSASLPGNAWRGAVLGLGVGALLLGSVVSLLHLRLNPGLGLGAALACWLFFALFYGLVVALGTGALAGLFSLPRRWRQRPDLVRAWGLASVLVVFFEAIALYGLTYDQTLFVRPQTIVGMTAYLIVVATIVALTVAVAVAVLLRVVAGLHASGGLGRACALLGGLALVAHVLSPLFFRGPPTPGPTVAETEVRIAETGLDVILVALDGTDPRVIERLLDDGALPEWRARIESGAYGALETLPHANSAVIWASVYSGYERRRHGVLDFYRVKIPGTGEGVFPVHRTWFKELLQPLGLLDLVVVSRPDLERLPLWEITDHFGLETGVVDGYFYSYPALAPETPGGYFLSYGLDSYLASAPEGDLTALPFYLQPVDVFGGEPLPRGVDLEWQTDAALRLLGSRPQPRFLNFYTHEPDAMQHVEWTAWEPERFFPWQRSGSGGAIETTHDAFDRLLADLEAAAGPDTVFLVVSDHGHSATPVHKLATQHRHGPPGVLLAWGGPVRRGVAAGDAHVFDVAPTVLHLLGLPVPEDAPGRVLTELFDDSFNERFPVRTVPHYEGMWKARHLDAARGRELNAEEIEKLKTMGYL